MTKVFSEITVEEALDRVQCWLPIQIYINGKIMWDDNLEIDGGWITYDEFINSIDDELYSSIVSSVEIEVVSFHHSVVHIYAKSNTNELWENE